MKITRKKLRQLIEAFIATADGKVRRVGKDAGEIIHAMSVAVSLKASVHDLIKTHWYHPTLSEIWTYPLEELAEQIKM